jgi:tetratricopeptide (TPR) repeat protein
MAEARRASRPGDSRRAGRREATHRAARTAHADRAAAGADGRRPGDRRQLVPRGARRHAGVGALSLADDYALDAALGETFQTWLAGQMPVLLTSAGWARLKLGDCEAAVQLLRRAEVLKRSEETAKGLGVCHYKLRQMSAAREQLAWFVERRPDDKQVPMLYADALESEGRYDEAVRILEQLAQKPCGGADAAECPSPKALEQRLASMRGRAKESWYQQQETSRYFRLAFRAGDHEELVAYVLQELEDALDEYVESYGFRFPPSPIEVVLYPEGDFKSVVVGGPEWAEGLFDGRIRIPIRKSVLEARRHEGLRTVLRHELVHALLAAMSDHRSIPPWLDEGIAQALSCRPRCADFRFPPSPGDFLEPASFQAPYVSFSPLKAGRAYRQSLYLVMALTRRAGEDVIRQIVGAVTTSSDLSSDGLLAPASVSFKDLHAHAAQLWQRRTPL